MVFFHIVEVRYIKAMGLIRLTEEVNALMKEDKYWQVEGNLIKNVVPFSTDNNPYTNRIEYIQTMVKLRS